MQLTYVLLAVSICWLPKIEIVPAEESHRILVLDVGRRLSILELESGKSLVQTALGFNTSIAVSPKGDTIAAISYFRGEADKDDGVRLNIFRSVDLELLRSGPFPSLPRFMYQEGAASDILFSSDGQKLVIPGAEPGFRVADLATTLLNCVRVEEDAENFLKPCEKPVAIRRCHGVNFLRVSDWPKVHVWNRTLNLLEVVDFRTGNVLSRLPLANDPEIQNIDPIQLENSDYRVYRMTGRGWVIADQGQYAYFLPNPPTRHPSVAYPTREPGLLKKIDLSIDPPKVIRKGDKPQPDLRSAIVSEAAGAIFALLDAWNEQFTHEPSRRVRVFNVSDLSVQREIDLPIADCRSLAASCDGKYLYALDAENSKIAVIDVASGQELKVLDRIGTHPQIMIALP
jgi:hypothetical protein